jgi:hypothetical protein
MQISHLEMGQVDWAHAEAGEVEFVRWKGRNSSQDLVLL